MCLTCDQFKKMRGCRVYGVALTFAERAARQSDARVAVAGGQAGGARKPSQRVHLPRTLCQAKRAPQTGVQRRLVEGRQGARIPLLERGEPHGRAVTHREALGHVEQAATQAHCKKGGTRNKIRPDKNQFDVNCITIHMHRTI